MCGIAMWHLRSGKQPTCWWHLRRKINNFLEACWGIQVHAAKQTDAYHKLGHAWPATLPGLLLNFLNQRVKTEGWLTDVATDLWKIIKLKLEWNVTDCVQLTACMWGSGKWGHRSPHCNRLLLHSKQSWFGKKNIISNHLIDDEFKKSSKPHH